MTISRKRVSVVVADTGPLIVLVTKNDRPVGIMISVEDAAETLIPEN